MKAPKEPPSGLLWTSAGANITAAIITAVVSNQRVAHHLMTLLSSLTSVWQASTHMCCQLGRAGVATVSATLSGSCSGLSYRQDAKTYLGCRAHRLAATWTGLELPCCCCPAVGPAPCQCQQCCLQALLLLRPLVVWGPWPRWHHLAQGLRGPQRRPALGLNMDKPMVTTMQCQGAAG